VRSESSTSFSVRRAKVPENESSWGREFQGRKVLGSEIPMYGTFVPESESTWEPLPVTVMNRYTHQRYRPLPDGQTDRQTSYDSNMGQ